MNFSGGRYCDGAGLYSKQDSNYCLKVSQVSELPTSPSHFSNGTWCYVSSACQTLRGGASVNSHVSWKSCAQGVDALLGDLSLTELQGVAAHNGQAVEHLAEMAYPVVRSMLMMQAVSYFDSTAGQTSCQTDHLPPNRPEWEMLRAQEVCQSGRPTLWCGLSVRKEVAEWDPCEGGVTYVSQGTEISGTMLSLHQEHMTLPLLVQYAGLSSGYFGPGKLM
jgi:hypothetical protein